MADDRMHVLERTGRAIWGDGWIRPLARELGVAHRSIMRWREGHEAYIDIERECAELLRQHARRFAACAAECEALAAEIDPQQRLPEREE